jgi:pimeloyl-ACP methyl ester carboxylesterase
MEILTEDLTSFYEHLCQGKSTVIIGHSMGGALAIHLSYGNIIQIEFISIKI